MALSERNANVGDRTHSAAPVRDQWTWEEERGFEKDGTTVKRPGGRPNAAGFIYVHSTADPKL